MALRSDLILHAREAGIAELLLTLIEPLGNSGFMLSFDIQGDAKRVLPQSTSIFLEGASGALCGFDEVGLDRTGQFLRSMRQANIPVVGILDSWKGIDRFWKNDGTLRELSDAIIVPDDITANYLKDRGIPDPLLKVTGHPVIEKLANAADSEKIRIRKTARAKLGLDFHENLLLFFSEPLYSTNGVSHSLLASETLLEMNVSDWLEKEYSTTHKIAYRTHPIEPSIARPENLIDANGLDLREAIFGSDLVVGLASTAMAYSVAAGIDVKNVQDILKHWNPSESNIPELLWNQLAEENVFDNTRSHIRSRLTMESGNATQNIINLIKTMSRS